MAKRSKADLDDFIDDDEGPQSKKSKPSKGLGSPNDQENAEPYWELSGNRRIVISDYKGKSMVNIREFYEKDGQHLPGKKGITMPIPQFKALVHALPEILEALKKRGESIPTPDFGDSAGGFGSSDGEESTERSQKKKGEKGIKSETKKNFEETSEDDE